MLSVALIGPDGAGKTTISRMLEESAPLPLKYIYMGINIEASNYALPTSRFVEYIRRRRSGKPGQSRSLQFRKDGSGSLGAILWAAARLVNRLADEWYRQVLSWSYQARGYIALYDRHFLFDFSLGSVTSRRPCFDERLHRWLLTHLYPRPDLIIYLDAPAGVLFARKGEKCIEELERRRQSFLRQREKFNNFVLVDATQPLATVYTDVARCIAQFWRTTYLG